MNLSELVVVELRRFFHRFDNLGKESPQPRALLSHYCLLRRDVVPGYLIPFRGVPDADTQLVLFAVRVHHIPDAIGAVGQLPMVEAEAVGYTEEGQHGANGPDHSSLLVELQLPGRRINAIGADNDVEALFR